MPAGRVAVATIAAKRLLPSARVVAGTRWSRFWVEVHRERPDLQAAFPEPDGVDADAFERWIATFGVAETGASGPFLPAERRR